MICVFLGPTMPLPEARTILDADYRPPAAMGDVLRAVSRGASAIAIVDGVFERVPSVWHKEILFALSRGVQVFGAASMGALRGAECHAFGMIGVGDVFEAFRDGILEDDDEVAVAHADAEHGYRCLSDAMVNVRRAVRDAVERALLSPEEGARLLCDAKARFYPDRRWIEIVRSAAWLGVERARNLLDAIPAAPDVKRADARRLLTDLARLVQAGVPRHTPTFDLENSAYLQATLTRECSVTASGGVETSRWMLASHVRLLRKDRDTIVREALVDLLVATLSARLGIVDGTFTDSFLTCGEVDVLRERLERAAVDLAVRLGPQLEPFLAAALARREELDAEVERVARKWTNVAGRGVQWPQPRDAGVDLEALGDWYEAELAPLDEGGEAHAKRLGFASWEEFMAELVAEYMARSVEP